MKLYKIHETDSTACILKKHRWFS